MKTFETYQVPDGLKSCVKKPIQVQAKQMESDFRVNSIEGDYAQGRAGDYLMRGIEGELYICKKEIFEKSYDFIVEQ